MIYYHLSGNCMEENYETYLPWVEGCTEHFYIKFSTEQSIERLKLIFIDMYKAKHEDTEKVMNEIADLLEMGEEEE